MAPGIFRGSPGTSVLFFVSFTGVTAIDPLAGQTVSHYRMLDHIGGGTMGLVYRALDLQPDSHVALEFLPPELTRDPSAQQRFRHEAKAASALQYSSISATHDLDENTDGETLNRRIERGPLRLDSGLAELAGRTILTGGRMWGEEPLILQLHGRSPLGPAPRTPQVRGPRRKNELARNSGKNQRTYSS